MNLTLKIWRQKDSNEKGQMVDYKVTEISEHMSFLEMMDVLNEQLVNAGEEPVAFDHDCREGICGMCSMYINGEAHGPDRGVTTCQLHMRMFKDGDTITIEPFRAAAFPVIKDLVVDRSAFDRIQHSGGYISVNTSGNTQDANAIPVAKQAADQAMDAATCIGCGACVATCKNSSAMLFVGAKVSQYALLPQGQVESGRSCEKHGGSNGFRRFWKLYQYRCLRGRVSKRNFFRQHRKNEQRVDESFYLEFNLFPLSYNLTPLKNDIHFSGVLFFIILNTENQDVEFLYNPRKGLKNGLFALKKKFRIYVLIKNPFDKQSILSGSNKKEGMVAAKNFPVFLTDLMVKWLDSFERDTVDEIMNLGLFTWKDTGKKRSKKKLVIDADHKIFIRTLPSEYSIYFNEISESCLQVLTIKDVEVRRTVFEYFYSNGVFSKGKKIVI